MRSEMLPLATSHIAHLCNQFNHVFALLISRPRFKSINLNQNRPKIKLFWKKKYKIFERSLPPAAPDPQNSYPIVNFWLRGWNAQLCGTLNTQP